MAPIKFEEDMKDKLEKRTLQPSANSWSALSHRLDKEEKKSSKKGIWWLGIAASVIGILLISNFLLNSKTKNKANTIIVEENTIIDTLKIEVPKLIIITPKPEVLVKAEENSIKKSTKKLDNTAIESTKYYANSTKTSSKNDLKSIVNKTQIVKTLPINQNRIQNKPLVINIENQTDKTNKTETINLKVTDNEINALLAKATEDIAIKKHKKVTIPLDYNSLLVDVEDDLDETFRDKMFKAVKKGYETVRESVAERND